MDVVWWLLVSDWPMATFRIELRGVVYPEDGWWIAHCLELDIAAEGSTPTEALKAVISLCDYQISTAIASGDIDSVFRSAPPEIWSLFTRANDIRQPRSKHTSFDRFEARQLAGAAY
jgi:hypothetical protein